MKQYAELEQILQMLGAGQGGMAQMPMGSNFLGKGPQPLPVGASPMDAAQAAMGMGAMPQGQKMGAPSLPNSSWSEGALPTPKIPKAKGMERLSPGVYRNGKGSVVKSKTGK